LRLAMDEGWPLKKRLGDPYLSSACLGPLHALAGARFLISDPSPHR